MPQVQETPTTVFHMLRNVVNLVVGHFMLTPNIPEMREFVEQCVAAKQRAKKQRRLSFKLSEDVFVQVKFPKRGYPKIQLIAPDKPSKETLAWEKGMKDYLPGLLEVLGDDDFFGSALTGITPELEFEDASYLPLPTDFIDLSSVEEPEPEPQEESETEEVDESDQGSEEESEEDSESEPEPEPEEELTLDLPDIDDMQEAEKYLDVLLEHFQGIKFRGHRLNEDTKRALSVARKIIDTPDSAADYNLDIIIALINQLYDDFGELRHGDGGVNPRIRTALGNTINYLKHLVMND